MTTARDEIFRKIREQKVACGAAVVPTQVLKEEIEAHEPVIIPERAKGSAQERLDAFNFLAQMLSTTIEFVDKIDDVPQTVSRYLRENQLPQEVFLSDEEIVTETLWGETAGLKTSQGKSSRETDGGVAVTGCDGALAEIGAFFFFSKEERPGGYNLMPDRQIIVMTEDQITGGYEDIWALARKEYGPGNMPRAVTIIAGPSRTADIQKTMVLGAHGPRAVHCIIVGKGRPTPPPETS